MTGDNRKMASTCDQGETVRLRTTAVGAVFVLHSRCWASIPSRRDNYNTMEFRWPREWGRTAGPLSISSSTRRPSTCSSELQAWRWPAPNEKNTRWPT